MRLSKALPALFLLGFALLPAIGQAPSEQPTGSHGLRNKHFQLFLRPRDASNKEGTQIVLYPQQPWKCMAWKFESEQGRVRLVNYFTGKTFQLDGGAVLQKSVAKGGGEAQTWKFVPLESGVFKLESASGSGVLTAVDVDGDIRVTVQPWKNLDTQQWQLVPLPDHFTA